MELPPALAARPFTVADARRAGLTGHDLRSDDLRTAIRGVRAGPLVEDSLSQAARAALCVAPRGTVISHVTALRLHGVDLPWQVEHDHRVHLTVPSRATVPRRAGLCVHQAAARPAVVDVAGLPVAAPATAWLQLATLVGTDALVVAADALTRRTSPLVGIDDLSRVLGALPPGARGRRRAAEALGLARPGTDSSMETRARLVLLRAGLPCPEVNVPVLAKGRFVALPDMRYTRERVAIEYDGDVHRTDARTWRRDVERRQRLAEAGWVVVTATADDVLRRPEAFARRVATLLRARRPMSD